MCGHTPLSEKDINDFRVNYSKRWLDHSDGFTINAFPCHGAVLAINCLCDEIEHLQKTIKILSTKKEVGRESDKDTPPPL